MFIWKSSYTLLMFGKTIWSKNINLDFCLLNGMTFWNCFLQVLDDKKNPNNFLKSFSNIFQYILFCIGTAKSFTGSLEFIGWSFHVGKL